MGNGCLKGLNRLGKKKQKRAEKHLPKKKQPVDELQVIKKRHFQRTNSLKIIINKWFRESFSREPIKDIQQLVVTFASYESISILIIENSKGQSLKEIIKYYIGIHSLPKSATLLQNISPPKLVDVTKETENIPQKKMEMEVRDSLAKFLFDFHKVLGKKEIGEFLGKLKKFYFLWGVFRSFFLGKHLRLVASPLKK